MHKSADPIRRIAVRRIAVRRIAVLRIAARLACLALLSAGCTIDGPPAPDAGNSDPIYTGLDLVIASGPIRGAREGDQRSFHGIPYAAPPVGENRWKPPRPPAAWSARRDAVRHGAWCAQLQPGGDLLPGSSEDCLTLDVVTPIGAAAGARRPVMVWLHPGGFVSGSGGDGSYDGINLSVAGGGVIVTLNYRLGALGFLAHAALGAEDPQAPSSGNYGLLDQQAALKWVKDNIAVFGGDPDNVTIFGSAEGGTSVCLHLISDGSRGLFQRAIVQSGACTVAALPALADAEQQGLALATAAGCSTGDAAAVRTCLRGKAPKDVLAALAPKPGLVGATGYAWGPILDGRVIAEQPRAALAAGKGAKVPLLVGANADEGTVFFKIGATAKDETELRGVLANFFTPLQSDAILQRYPLANYAAPTDAAVAILDDMYLCDARRLAHLSAGAGQATWEYYFLRAFKWKYPDIGAFRGAEIPLVFQDPLDGVPLKDDELSLCKSMQAYWTHFAKAGDPNYSGATAWPAYKADADEHLEFDAAVTGDMAVITRIQAGSGLRKSACDFWDGL